MITYDLRQQDVSMDEVLRAAADAPVQIVAKDGMTFLLEPTETFDEEVARLGQSAAFMAFLAERGRERATRSLDEIAAEIDAELAREAAKSHR